MTGVSRYPEQVITTRLSALLVGLASLVLVAGGATSVQAHSAFIGSDPEDGAVLDARPDQVTLFFNENVKDPAYVAIDAGDGPVEVEASIDGAEVVAELTDIAATSGEFTVAYRIVSADSHPIQGSTSFTVEAPAPSEPTASEPTASGPADGPAEDKESVEDDTDGSALWWVLGALLAIAVIVALALAMRRKNSASA